MFIMVCSLINLKAHMLIEAFSLRVLFIYRKTLYAIIFNPIVNQSLPQPPASFFRGNKKHFKRPILHSHKGNRLSCLVLCNQKMSDSV